MHNLNYFHYFLFIILLAGGWMFIVFIPAFLLSEEHLRAKLLSRWLCWWALSVIGFTGLLIVYIACIAHMAYFVLWPYPIGAVIGWVLFNRDYKLSKY
ncbi:hypothetical protein ACE38W_01585 [Chitinophaga sp. Hz27]|uniref:hypothetical protein n=1 Tax=Chitinophaga sp. Hz27 TaxID=3347169 RepID=UPI0035E39BB6